MNLEASQQDGLKTELKIQREILQVEDNLVLWIEAALRNCDYGQSKSEDELEEAQFRNLVRVSEATESPEVIKNFLRYQVGRDKKWGRGKNSLAERIIQDINGNLRLEAEAISQRSSSLEIKRIWLELIRRYLGYGARYLKYLKTEDPQVEKEIKVCETGMKGILKKASSSISVVDELIKERREEANLEQRRS